MTAATINFVNLNKRCEGWFMGVNSAAPLCHGTPEVVGAAIVGIGADEIRVEARTSLDSKQIARFVRKSRHLNDGLQYAKRSRTEPTKYGKPENALNTVVR